MTASGVSLATPLLASLLTVGLLVIPVTPARAATYNVGCFFPAGVGDTVGLKAAVLDASTTPSSDIIHLSPACDYSITTPIVVQPDSNHQTLTIHGHGTTLYQPGSDRIMTVAPGADLLLRNVTLLGGGNTSLGGSILNDAATVILRRVTVSSAEATSLGGAIFNEGGNLTLVRSRVEQSDSPVGAGIYNDGGAVLLVRSSISNNSAGHRGGGIFNESGTVRLLSDSRVTDNEVSGTAGEGGGIANLGTVIVNGSEVSHNEAPGGGGILSYGRVELTNAAEVKHNAAEWGAGIYNGNDLLISDQSSVSDNTANVHGGGVYTLRQVKVLNSYLYNNVAAQGLGGAVFVDEPFYASGAARLTLTDATISYNEAVDGGGVYNLKGHVVSRRSIIGNNRASSDGGAVYNTQEGNLGLFNSSAVINNTAPTGGGVYNAGTTRVTDSHVSTNRATTDGGGIYSTGGTARVAISRSLLSDNRAMRDGGAVANSNGSDLQVVNSTSLVHDVAGEDGGAIANDGGAAAVIASTLVTNSASNGGGISSSSGRLRVVGSTLRANSATTGGGIANRGDAYVDSTTLEANAATGSYPFGGGGIYNDGPAAALTVTRSTLSENTSQANGGGIANGEDIPVGGGSSGGGAKATLTNVTFSKNTAVGFGGGMFNGSSSTLDVNNTTVAENAAQDGGGIAYGGTATAVRNSIFSDNSGGNCMSFGGTISGSFNLESPAGTCGSAFVSGSPNLGPLLPLGGLTRTRALNPNSSAIDTGGPLGTCAPSDQRGYSRVDGDGDGIVECDKGAFELGGKKPGGCSKCRTALPPGSRRAGRRPI